MSFTTKRRYLSKTLRAGELSRAIRDTLASFMPGPQAPRLAITHFLRDGTDENPSATFLEVDRLCDLTSSDWELRAYTGTFEKSASITIRAGATTEIYASSDLGAELTHQIADKFSSALQLEPVPAREEEEEDEETEMDPAAAKAVEALSERLRLLEEKVQRQSQRLSCLLSYRFDETSESIAMKVQRFLELLDVNVVTASAYEPRSISAKVTSMLKEPLDFVVLIVAGKGESMWTRDEIRRASERGVFVVPLVEKGAEFVQGMFGDLETIPFDSGHIGDAFIRLLEAVKFVRTHSNETGTSTS